MRRSGAHSGRRRRSRARTVEGVLGATAILAAVVIAVTTRTTAPDDYGEEVAPATGPVPVAAPGGPTGPVTLSSYPLVVGDGLRVTGHERGITAHPLSAAGDDPAHWRYQRSDDELVRLALASSPSEGGQVIVSLWDDGLLAGVDALTGALDEVAGRSLAGLIDPDGFAGCWNPRTTRAGTTISRHAWGVAVDLNFGQNPTGLTSVQDPRLLEIFARWGFADGSRWLIPDAGHFEYVAPPQP